MALALLPLFCTGCWEVGPDYHRPAAIMAPRFKEAAGWKPSTPMDAIHRGQWWTIYHDAELDRLERAAGVANQNLVAAQYAYESAQAAVQAARANFWPTATLSFGVTHQHNGGGTSGAASTSTLGIGGVGGTTSTVGGGGGFSTSVWSITGGASWAPDFWGRIRREVESSVAAAQASAADVSSALLSAQGTLATDYFNLLAEDSLAHLLRDTVKQYTAALKITRNQYTAGVAARSDVVTAEAQLETVQAQLIAVGVARAQYEHAIAVLAGMPPSALAVPDIVMPRAVPVVPAGVPSELLERRPDIATAERTMQEENALIGYQVGAFFPTITLSASGGFESTALSSLFSAASSLWSLGANVGETLFAGGARTAAVMGARATYLQSVANYRSTVLTAFQQIEDQLAALHILEREEVAEVRAVKAAQQSVQIAINEYRAGTAAYTAVITAEETELTNEVTLLSIHQARLVASVSLIEALGGGWTTAQVPSKDELQEWNPVLPSGPMMTPLRNP